MLATRRNQINKSSGIVGIQRQPSDGVADKHIRGKASQFKTYFLCLLSRIIPRELCEPLKGLIIEKW